MLRFYPLLFLLLSGHFWANAQWKISAKKEILIDTKAPETNDVLVLDEKKVLLESLYFNKFSFEEEQISIRILDENLEVKHEIKEKFKDNYSLEKRHITPKMLYYLLRKRDKTDFSIIKINPETAEKNLIEGNFLTKMPISFFKSVGNKIIFGGVYNGKPVVELFSAIERTGKILPDIYANNLRIIDVLSNEENKTIFVLLKDEKHCKTLVKIYDYDGKLKNTINFEEHFVLLTSQMINFNGHENLLIGNYAKQCSDNSQGIYALKIIDDKLQNVNYVDFDQLQHFFDFMPAKRQEKTKNRLAQKRKQDKNVYFQYHLTVHKLRQTPTGAMLYAEVFFPEYQAGNISQYNSKGVFVSDNYYNNYRFSHNLICSFNQDGKLVWDNVQILDKVQSKYLSAKTTFISGKNENLGVYFKNGNLATNLIKENKKIEEPNISPLDDAIFKAWDTPEPHLENLSERKLLLWGIRPQKENPSDDIFYLWKMIFDKTEIENKLSTH